jgi:hypothetical protein
MTIEERADIPAKWLEMDIHDKMAHIAEFGAHYPYDLIRDVWAIAGESRISEETFEMLLNQAIETFLAYDSEEAYCADRVDRY